MPSSSASMKSDPAPSSDSTASSRRIALLEGPIVPTMLRLALPTIGVQLAQTLVGVAETYFVSYLGTDALAGVSLVFPMLMIMIMVSAGGLGGGVASSVARSLGAGRHEDADLLVTHALALAIAAGLMFTVLLLAVGPTMYHALGGRGAALEAANTYSFWVFAGAIPLWTVNLLSAALRGAGNFRVPATVTLAGTAVLIVLSPALIFGFGPIPRLGVAGAGVAVSAFYLGAAIVLARYLWSGAAVLRMRPVKLQRRYFAEILQVGLLGGLNAIQPNVAALVVTAAVGVFGIDALAGYGAASRLDYVLVPILFGLGTAVVTMVGISVGAGDMVRARRVAWTGAIVGFAFSEAVGLTVSGWPEAWLHLFSKEPGVVGAGVTYLRTVGPAYGALGLGMLLGFAAQGGGRMMWPFVAGVIRMLTAAGIGWFSVVKLGLHLPGLFAIVALALVLYGAVSTVAVHRGWIWPVPS